MSVLIQSQTTQTFPSGMLVEFSASPGRRRSESDKKAASNNNTIEVPEYIVDPGTKITYLKGKFLGKGGFARVHELTDLTTNRVYAGKIIPRSRLNRPHQKEKIDREIDLHRPLAHKNIVRFHDFFGDVDNVYIILECCSRKSLVHVLKQRNTLTEPETRYFMQQLAEGVEHIHSQGIVHRDLKLGNMLLSEDMQLKIADFGLATRISPDGPKKYAVCGTPNYIAPEVLKMQGHGFAADIWAMGCIMYAMLVGTPPFETATLGETYQRITQNLYSIPAQVSATARDLISSMLRSDPSERPTVTQILQHQFFSQPLVLTELSPSCCYTPPRFPSTVPEDPKSAHSPRAVRSTPAHGYSDCRETKKVTHLVSKLQVQCLKRESSSKSSEAPSKPDSTKSGIMMTLSRVLCPDKRSTQKAGPTVFLHKTLLACLEETPSYATQNPTLLQNVTVPFVTKWIDYSNKYGFGFQLSDNSVGVQFNDTSRLNLSPDKSRVEYHDAAGKMSVYDPLSIPGLLEEKFDLLKYFAQYMDENLTEGADLVPAIEASSKKKKCIPYMKRWVRTTQAIVMQLSCSTLQVNFFKDHTKLVINANHCLLLYINEDRQSCFYSLNDIASKGCEDSLRGRLQFALSALREFLDVEMKDNV
ncbi:serine/threonine-protein kinase PLK1-like [Ornithodoros turicata]|uniref:serine/threonine-protein kinase PLK1-like n=1 Tax=Ornithodoros turicata TaxID=34597 RepID=UPI003138C32B